jgi:hypothetical protein
MIELKLSPAEANALQQLIDAAVRAQGIQAAAAGLRFVTLLNEAITEFNMVASEPKPSK